MKNLLRPLPLNAYVSPAQVAGRTPLTVRALEARRSRGKPPDWYVIDRRIAYMWGDIVEHLGNGRKPETLPPLLPDAYLSPAKVADYTPLTEDALEARRYRKKLPRWSKRDGRIFYRWSDVVEFFESRRRLPNAEMPRDLHIQGAEGGLTSKSVATLDPSCGSASPILRPVRYFWRQDHVTLRI